MRFASLLPLLLLTSGIVLMVYSLVPKESSVQNRILEGGTFEIFECQGELTVQVNGSACVDLREVEFKELSRGTSVEGTVRFPLLKMRGSKLELTVSNYDARWGRSYHLSDGGFLIPLEEGQWNVSAASDGQITLYEVERYYPARGDLTRGGDSVKAVCSGSNGTYLILYNPSQEPLEVRVTTSRLDLHALFASIGLILMSLLVRRYFHAVEGGRGVLAGVSRHAHGQVR